MLREADLYLPSKEWGRIVLAVSASRAGTAWTDHGTSRQERGLKHRADNETRTIPIPEELSIPVDEEFQAAAASSPPVTVGDVALASGA